MISLKVISIHISAHYIKITKQHFSTARNCAQQKKFKNNQLMSDSKSSFHLQQQQLYNAQLEKFGVKIVLDDVKGRCLVATKDLQPGNVVMVEAPFAFTLHTDHLEKRCCACFNMFEETQTPMACGNCKIAR
jgi:hypothetical protein